MDEDWYQRTCRRIAAGFVVGAPPDDWTHVCWEHDERRIQRECETRYGPASADDHNKLATHLDRLSRLVLEAARHGREHWTEEQRRVYDHQPDDVHQNLQQDRSRAVTGGRRPPDPFSPNRRNIYGNAPSASTPSSGTP